MRKSKKTSSTPTPTPEAFHQPFSWLLPHYKTDANAHFFALTKDVCHGIKTCIDVAHFSMMDRDTEELPTLDINATERLLRLALRSSQMLGAIAAVNIDGLNDQHPEEPT